MTTRQIYLLLTIILFLWGCGSTPPNQNSSPAILEVNGFPITQSDLEQQKRKMKTYFLYYSPKEQEKMVMEMIIENVLLLQEAEKRKINQDHNFLKSIEHFWQQSLIEALLKERSKEIRNSIQVKESEVEKHYEKLKEKFLVRKIIFSEKHKPNIEQFQKIGINYIDIEESKKNIEEDSDWFWVSYKDLSSTERELWQKLKKDKAAFSNGEWWFLQKIEAEELPPFEDIREEIHKDLMNEKEKSELSQWIESLKKGSHVKYLSEPK